MFLHSPEDFKKVEPILEQFELFGTSIRGSMNYIVSWSLTGENELLVSRIKANCEIELPIHFALEIVDYQGDKVCSHKVVAYKLVRTLSKKDLIKNGFVFELVRFQVEKEREYSWDEYNSEMMTLSLRKKQGPSLLEKVIVEETLFQKSIIKSRSIDIFKTQSFQKAKLPSTIDYLLKESKV